MSYALVCDGLIDGTGRYLSQATVLVEDNEIIDVSESASDVPDGFEVIELQGKTLLPGLIDLHVHVDHLTGSETWMKEAHFSSGRRALLAAARARRALEGGVTTLRDLGSTDGIALALKEAVELGQVEGSRIVSCGAAVVMTGGHGYQHGKYEADGPDEIRAAIRQNLKDGADLIKICQSEGLPYPEYTMEELEAVVHECHMRGKKVACHVETEPGLGMAVRAGIDTIEHGFNPDDETLELMAEKGTYWVPTITINRRMRQEEHDEESYVEGVRRAFLQKGMQGPEVERKLDFLRNCFAAFPERFERGLELGVKIVAGSDGPRPKGYAGERGIPMEAVRNELVKFVQWGMKPMDAILAGTSLAAEALGREDRLGCVKPGYVADLVAVDGNPLEDIEDIDNISFVMKEGQPV